MEGTVFSGHALRTTLGNTLRVIYYHLFAIYKTFNNTYGFGKFNLETLFDINEDFGLAV